MTGSQLDIFEDINPAASPSPIAAARFEQFFAEESNEELSRIEKKDQISRAREDQIHRRGLQLEILKLTYIYLAVVCSMVVLQGLHGNKFLWFTFEWHLADNVMITLLSTTTVTIVGLSMTVARYYFKGQEQEKSEKEK